MGRELEPAVTELRLWAQQWLGEQPRQEFTI
jgi:DNA-binding HxlR family transcriptional regulator